MQSRVSSGHRAEAAQPPRPHHVSRDREISYRGVVATLGRWVRMCQRLRGPIPLVHRHYHDGCQAGLLLNRSALVISMVARLNARPGWRRGAPRRQCADGGARGTRSPLEPPGRSGLLVADCSPGRLEGPDVDGPKVTSLDAPRLTTGHDSRGAGGPWALGSPRADSTLGIPARVAITQCG